MKFGQITNSHNKYSKKLDYVQFDICGLNKDEAVDKLNNLLNKNNHIPKIILHSDWQKKGCSENNLPFRAPEYIEIFTELSKMIDVIGITLHPMFRNKISMDCFLKIACDLNNSIPVFIENRSNEKILISTPNEIINLSNSYKMTIDIPQLLISCKYDYQLFLTTLSKINWDNVYEIHLANVKRVNNRTFVGRNLDDGLINMTDIKPYLKNKLVTLEILHGTNAFEKNISYINNL